MRAFIGIATALVFLAVAALHTATTQAASSPTSSPPLADCTGTGATQVSQDPPVWRLICSGDCTSPHVCKERDGSDPLGEFKFCGCRSGDTDACCTVVLRTNGADPPSWYPEAYGSCPPCPLPGTCQWNPVSSQPYCD